MPRAKKSEPKKPEFPKVFETFRHIGSWELGNLQQDKPSSFNGGIDVVRYRVTVEEIPEPKEVIAERLLKLWRECDNHHHWYPLTCSAKKHGIELPPEEFGKDRKPKGGR